MAEPTDPFALPGEDEAIDTEGRLVLVSETEVVYEGEGDILAMELVDFAALAGMDWAGLPQSNAEALQWWFEGEEEPGGLFSVAETDAGEGPVLTVGRPADEVRLTHRTQDFSDAAQGTWLTAEMEARVSGFDTLSLVMAYHGEDDSYQDEAAVPGDGEWQTVQIQYQLSDDDEPGHAEVGIARYPGGEDETPAEIRRVNAWLAESP